jgi:hypothetical protein
MHVIRSKMKPKDDRVSRILETLRLAADFGSRVGVRHELETLQKPRFPHGFGLARLSFILL